MCQTSDKAKLVVTSVWMALLFVVGCRASAGPGTTLENADPSAWTNASWEVMTYVEPCARFTCPIPPGWHVEQKDSYAVIRSPDARYVVYAFCTVGSDAQDAVSQVLGEEDLGLSNERVDSQCDGFRQIITYETAMGGGLAQAFARRFREEIYVLLVYASSTEDTRSQDDANRIIQQFVIKGRSFRRENARGDCP